MQVVENIKITSNYCTVYDTVIDGTPQVRGESATVNFTDTFHDCKMKPAAMKAIKKAANVIVAVSRKRHFAAIRAKVGCTSYRHNDVMKAAIKSANHSHLATFVTLTLPSAQRHTDREITSYCLNAFFAYARKYFKVRYFIWKKELQANGNLHYHIMCDRFIDHEYLRRAWNRIINKGQVKDVHYPFNYVDRYHDKWTAMYKDGFDRDKMWNYIASIPSIIDEINRKAEGNLMDSWNEVQKKVVDRELEKYYRIYQKEMQEPDENKRFRNPNTTDVQAVKSPALVSAYLAKYISKDIDETPELAQYWDTVDYIKKQIYSTLFQIKDRKEHGQPFDDLTAYIDELKEYLSKYRLEKCPILGKLWYKSETLTPFLKGTTEVIYSKLYDEITRLCDWLYDQQQRRNENRAKANKKPCRLITQVYAKNPDGTDDTSRIVCTTLLVTSFELQTQRGKDGKLMFPLLSRLWSKFFNDCINYNYKRGLYDYED